MKDHRHWMLGFLLVLTSALSGDAQSPGHVPYRPKATNQKQLECADDHKLRKALPMPAVAEDPKELERAESTIAKYYDDVGKRLTATLADEEIPIRERVQAAKRLGIMKYPPAIPILIRHNLLLDPDVYAISSDWTIGLPCIRALVEYGDAAVPQVIEAWLDAEEKSSDRNRLIMPIGAVSIRKSALIYAKGLAANTKDKDRSKQLEELIKLLSE